MKQEEQLLKTGEESNDIQLSRRSWHRPAVMRIELKKTGSAAGSAMDTTTPCKL